MTMEKGRAPLGAGPSAGWFKLAGAILSTIFVLLRAGLGDHEELIRLSGSAA
jgi:hypothetical protein